MIENNHEFIFTNSNNKAQHISAFRTPPPNTLLDRWVKCHLIRDKIILGDINAK